MKRFHISEMRFFRLVDRVRCWDKRQKVHRIKYVRFQVLTAASMKMAAFWDVAPCSLVKVYRRFGGACCFLCQDFLPVVSTFETPVNFYRNSRRNIPEGSHLQD
jgi:hypothetical protein